MSSFIAALGGLRAHQSWIDVIGNNLANTNTPGFKASRALFADLLSVTFKSATSPTPTIGGTNPLQVGLGVEFAHVDKNLTQGALNLTNRTFDLAILGRGFFAVDDGGQTLYTRVGAFGLDAQGNMVDQRSGYKVLDANSQSFQIDTNAVFAPQATSKLDFGGNLPAQITGPLAEVLATSSSFSEGTPAQATGANSGPFTIPAGESWTMELIVNGGAPQTVSILGTGSMTALQIANEINAQTDHVIASVTGSQEIALQSDKSGSGSTITINGGDTATDLKGLLGLVDFVQGTESLATSASDLNTITTNISDYLVGDAVTITGTEVDGTPLSATFQYGVDGTTIGDLAAFVDAQFASASAAFNATTGLIELTAATTGEADLSLSITDPVGQAGQTDWAQHAFTITTNGTGPDEVVTSAEVFDTAGTSHVLTATYTRQDDGSWDLVISMPPTEGTVLAGTIAGITFNEDGSIQTPTTGTVSVQFGSLSAQAITLDLGDAGQFTGLTQFGNPASVVADFQDGFGAGELANMSVEPDGTVRGFYTNGQSQGLGSIGVATFTNPQGLEDVGENYLRETPNSGARILSAGVIGAAGEVVGGAIEGSNVDTAEEFVQLIRAQRGFQANARVVTVQDELLAEVVNIV